MRYLVYHEKLLAVLLLLAVATALLPLRPPRMWLYPLVRDAAHARMDWQTRHMAVFETEHFIIKYTAHDSANVAMIAQAAEAAYEPVRAVLGDVPAGKSLLLVYPDRTAMNKVFGWSGAQSAMGVYWGGVIQVLTPRSWLKAGESTPEFIKTGPMVHEFTHLAFDYMTNGNYSRWFTEGLAQYVEYKTNGYEWLTVTNRHPGRYYTQGELDGDFDSLADQSLAYRSALAAVRYIVAVRGETGLQDIIGRLRQGRSVPGAIEDVLGIDYGGYETAWRKWAAESMQ